MRNIQFGIIVIIALAISSCSRPMANFTIQQDKRQAPSKVTLTNISENADEFEWDMGNGEMSTDSAGVSYRYLLSGNYIVKLTAKKGNKKRTIKKEITVEAPTECLVELATEHGSMLIKLFDETPKHRDNFLKLADEKFYDDLLFHRVMNNFMIQGGDPDSKGAAAGARLGTGGPGYQVDAEFVPGKYHVKGALAAARQGDGTNPEKKSSGSQFYIVHGQSVTADQLRGMELQKGISYDDDTKAMYIEKGGTPFLDNEYTVFGIVVEGLDVIDKIAAVKGDGSNRPIEDLKMKIRVIK